MIITRTPFRVSLVGGGTDFKDYYKLDYGSVISSTIDKYLYVTINGKFDGKINIRYSHTEEVNNIDAIINPIIREALKMTNITNSIEITTISDVPMKGTGLGSSSALAVGLLNALYTYKGYNVSNFDLANQACKLEIDILNAPIGKQDQFAAAIGGLRYYRFNKDESVNCVDLLRDALFERVRFLEESLLLFHLGTNRSSNDILKKHKENIDSNKKYLDNMVAFTEDLLLWLKGEKSTYHPGSLLDMSWEYKKQLSDGKCSSVDIDCIISKIRKLNILGTKIVGAGGGGFLLVMCEKEQQSEVRQALSNLQELPFKFTNKGSEVIYNSGV